jgi:hypothetical protein
MIYRGTGRYFIDLGKVGSKARDTRPIADMVPGMPEVGGESEDHDAAC